MVNLLQYAEYGTGIFGIIAVVFIVVYFIRHLERKDREFIKVLTNHLSEQREAMDKLTSAIQMLLSFLQRNGNKQ